MENFSDKPQEQLRDKSHGERLQKVMARNGVASRRDCEKLIEDGLVYVNGQQITKLPVWVDTNEDKVEVSGKLLKFASSKSGRASKTGRKLTYIMLNKPKRIISTTDDDKGRTNVVDLVDLPGTNRLFPVGRLDSDSTGFVLLTNDGEMANKITHPRFEISKEYHVVVRGKITQEDLQKLRDGLFLVKKNRKDGGRDARPTDARPTGARLAAKVQRSSVESVAITGFDRDRARGDQTHLKMILKEGRNREIRRILARVGYKVVRLGRTAIGPVKLKGVAIGQWRKLTGNEIAALRKACNNAAKARS